MSETDHKALAAQLRCPSGVTGEKTAENMFRANGNMIRETIDVLGIRSAANVLEIGFGNARHLPYLLEQAPGVMYYGLDVSDLMVEQASANNTDAVKSGTAHFYKVTGDAAFNFPSAHFNYSFSVNAVYFWQLPIEHIKEIHRVLKPGGKLALAFVPEAFARTLPFTRHGFSLYSPQAIENMFVATGFGQPACLEYEEKIMGNGGHETIRPFVIVTGINNG